MAQIDRNLPDAENTLSPVPTFFFSLLGDENDQSTRQILLVVGDSGGASSPVYGQIRRNE